MRVTSLLVLAGCFATTSARAGGLADESAHDEPFIAVDVGAEAGSETETTAGLVVGVESNSNNFLVSAAVTRSHGHTSFGDIAFGYYRAFHLGWLTPEIGAEIGLLNEPLVRDGHRTHHVTLLERVGGALLHHFENHMFIGVVSDVNFATDHLANVRGLIEVGVQL